MRYWGFVEQQQCSRKGFNKNPRLTGARDANSRLPLVSALARIALYGLDSADSLVSALSSSRDSHPSKKLRLLPLTCAHAYHR